MRSIKTQKKKKKKKKRTRHIWASSDVIPVTMATASSTKRTSQFQFFLQIISQTNSVTYCVNCFAGKLVISLHMKKRYPVNLVLFRKRHFFTYRKFYWITCSQTFLFEVAY